MLIKSGLAAIGLALLAPQGALADGLDSPLVGSWRLVSFETEFQDGSPRRQVLGPQPRGDLVFTPQGRMVLLMEADGRAAAKTDEERAALMRSMIAWSGSWRVDGDRYVLKVDTSWNPAATGTERTSTFRIDGQRVHFTAPWAPSPVLPGAPIARGVSVWERSK